MMKFDKLDAYFEQKESQQSSFDALVEREQKVQEELVALKHKYETLFTESLKTGVDKSKELDSLSVKIEETDRSYKNRQKERSVYTTLVPHKITAESLKADFMQFKKEFEKAEVQPKLDAILEVKKQFTRAVFDYIAVLDAYQAEKNAVEAEIGRDWAFDILGSVGPQTTAEVERYFITPDAIRQIERGHLPAGVTEDDIRGTK
ncbi:hypothetical protein AS030_12715 [Fictibacillus enclensis]|uniref:Uncharacterized protein n=1 Tax=Fictibacillus enclensis TaxID=1017270 RepID=A0A0V8J8S0_9BACL|nr:hypothetical protein [Fictibacillus enclensis]KSU83421.1 hypothetical protein AS030_12715 [Fictibacillus enclensis]